MPELPGHIPQDAEMQFDVSQHSAEFRTMPKAAENFGKVPQAAERKENHTLTVRKQHGCLKRRAWRGRSEVSSIGASRIDRESRGWIAITIRTNENIILHRKASRR